MQILFIHGNYPAQFHWLAAGLGCLGKHDVRFLTARADAAQHPIAGVRVELYSDQPCMQAGHSPLHQATDAAIHRAKTIHQCLERMALEGFVPRLVVVHGGNGLGLLIKQLIPDCTVIGYFEWYFHPESTKLLLGRDDRQSRNQVHLRNLVISQEILDCDAAVVPTPWQAEQFPSQLRSKLTVIFDGVDAKLCHPPRHPSRDWPLQLDGESGGLILEQNQLLLSYATRGMEPLRGFPEFMRALPQVLLELPELHVVIAGRDRSAYGAVAPSHSGSWKARLLDELGQFEGRERVHFTGLLPRGQYIQMLQRTNLHCYFSRPYVTSWSLFEAVACGAQILTNPGGTTTGAMPDQLPNTIALDAGSAQVASSMAQLLKNPTTPVQPPEWLWRHHTQGAWQELINAALQSSKISGSAAKNRRADSRVDDDSAQPASASTH